MVFYGCIICVQILTSVHLYRPSIDTMTTKLERKSLTWSGLNTDMVSLASQPEEGLACETMILCVANTIMNVICKLYSRREYIAEQDHNVEI